MADNFVTGSWQGEDVNELQPNPRALAWAATMRGHGEQVVTAHSDTAQGAGSIEQVTREIREDRLAATLCDAATMVRGAGHRAKPETPDPHRTCFERDRDRIVHSTPFRRLAGKTQAVVFPTDHQRTRLTHALEVAQVATSVARGLGANVALADAIALGHDCGHGPGGHASEEAFDMFLPDGFDHGPWGADVELVHLNLCEETLDGIRNHSWSRPAPQTIEGEICSWADRIAYCCHDLEDAIHAGVVDATDLPQIVTQVLGTTRRVQLGVLIRALIETTCRTGQVSMDADTAAGLAALRRFNYERIYTRQESLEQSHAVIRLLQSLVSFYIENPAAIPAEYRSPQQPVWAAVSYTAGMTDRFAFDQAERLLGWEKASLPRGIGYGA